MHQAQVRAARGAQRSKRSPNSLTALRSVRGFEATVSRRSFLKRAAAMAVLTALPSETLAQDRFACRYVENRLKYFRLPNGRRLAYAEYGDPHPSWTILHQHGIPSCRLELDHFRDVLRCRPGVRMIAIDRPGIGRSDPDPASDFLTWPADVEAFANGLGIECFSMTSMSAGSPYALAVARAMPVRVTSIGLICPVAPLEVAGETQGFFMKGVLQAQHHPHFARIFWRVYCAALSRHPNEQPIGARAMPPPDKAILTDPYWTRLLSDMTIESLYPGPAQTVRAFALFAQPWASWIKDVQTKVIIFQGCQDVNIPLSMPRYLAATLSNVEMRLYPDQAHISVPINKRAEILAAVVPS
jgi:pimeloyl-ACP methyl ester carboxylesterase